MGLIWNENRDEMIVYTGWGVAFLKILVSAVGVWIDTQNGVENCQNV